MKDIQGKPGDKVFRAEIDVGNALEWAVTKGNSLQDELIDEAEEIAAKEITVNGVDFFEVDATGKISIEGTKPGSLGKFVVEFILD